MVKSSALALFATLPAVPQGGRVYMRRSQDEAHAQAPERNIIAQCTYPQCACIHVGPTSLCRFAMGAFVSARSWWSGALEFGEGRAGGGHRSHLPRVRSSARRLGLIWVRRQCCGRIGQTFRMPLRNTYAADLSGVV